MEELENDTPLARIPEYTIFEALNIAFKWIRNNHKEKGISNPSATYLNALFVGIKNERTVVLKEIERIILTDIDDPKALEIHMMFNPHRAAMPTIHITLPGETFGQNAMMQDLNYAGIIDDEENEEYQETLTRSFKASYNIIITAGTATQTSLLTHLVKHIFISMTKYFEMNGLQNIVIGRADLSIYGELIPNAFAQGVSLTFEYMTSAPDMQIFKYIKGINFEGKAIDK